MEFMKTTSVLNRESLSAKSFLFLVSFCSTAHLQADTLIILKVKVLLVLLLLLCYYYPICGSSVQPP